jgi:hypothetical protein
MNKSSVKSILDQRNIPYVWTKLIGFEKYKLSLTPILDTYIYIGYDANEQVNHVEFITEIYKGSTRQKCNSLSWKSSSNFELMLSQFIAGVSSYEECFSKVKSKMDEINSICSLYDLSVEDFDFRHQSKLIKQE